MEKMSKIIKPILLVLFFAIILTSYMAGGMYARYKSNNYSSDEARVAKWKITHLDEKGYALDLDLGFSEHIISSETGTSGKWIFEIKNESEVAAILNTDSVIRIELHHENFPELTDTNKKWDFLGSANPIKFTVDILNGSVNDVSTEVNEVRVLNSNVSKMTIVETVGTDALTEGFIATTNKRYYYIEYKLSDVISAALSDVLSSDEIANYLQFGINSSNAKTIVLSWNVDAQTSTENSSSSTSPSKTYNRYTISNTKGSTAKGPWEIYNNSTKSTETVYINSTPVDFADYFLYSTGEPTFTVTNNGEKTIVSYSELIKNDVYLTEVTSREPSGDNITYDEIKLYMERLEYEEYKKFLKDYTEFIGSYGYIQYGLSIKIGFDLNIVQVD